MTQIDITADYGQITLGSLRVHWWNQEDADSPGFFLLGWKRYNLEFGQIDQDRPGIYLTQYVNEDVQTLRTFFQL